MNSKRLFTKGILVIWLCIMGATQSISQEVPDEAAVKSLLASFFSAMKSKDVDVLKRSFHGDAVMHTTLADGGVGKLGNTAVADFLTRVSSSPAVLDEQLLGIDVQVDGNMAHAWTPYRFYVDGTFSHCGTNSFQLIKTGEGWQIVHIIDTRRKEGCD